MVFSCPLSFDNPVRTLEMSYAMLHPCPLLPANQQVLWTYGSGLFQVGYMKLQPFDSPLYRDRGKPAFWPFRSVSAAREEMPSVSDMVGKNLHIESLGAVLGKGAIYHLKGAPPSLCDEISS